VIKGKNTLIVLILFLLVVKVKAQSIVVGQHNCNDSYVYYNPPHLSQNFISDSIDVNQDGEKDFVLKLIYNNMSMVGGSYYTSITTLGSNQIVFGRKDSSYSSSSYCNQNWAYYNIPKNFSINDTITDNLNWQNGIFTLASYDYYLSCTHSSPGISGNDVYIGLRLINLTDTLNAWLKFKTVNNNTIQTEEIVCEIKSDSIKVLPKLNNMLVNCGTNFALKVNAKNATACINYQWSKNGVDILGATSDSLYFNPVSLSDSGVYSCQVSTFFDTIIETAKLSIQNVLPSIPNVSIVPYTNWYSFWLEGDLTNIVSYQWTKNGVDIQGADSSSISFGNLVLSDSAIYSCKLGAMLSMHCPDSVVRVNFVTTNATFGVMDRPKPKITQVGNKLISNYSYGNVWYFQDSFTYEYLSSRQQIDMVKEGQYLVVVNNDYCIGSTNFKDYYFEFNVTPNPFENEIIVSIKREQLYTSWELVDDLGVIVLTGSLTSIQNSINTTTIAKGHYYLKINGQVMKMIKQ